MAVNYTDAILHYKIGIWGELGYGFPNPSNDKGTINPVIWDLVDIAGQHLFHLMHQEDADMRTPPSPNIVAMVHQLYVRVTKIMGSRAVLPSGGAGGARRCKSWRRCRRASWSASSPSITRAGPRCSSSLVTSMSPGFMPLRCSFGVSSPSASAGGASGLGRSSRSIYQSLLFIAAASSVAPIDRR